MLALEGDSMETRRSLDVPPLVPLNAFAQCTTLGMD